MDGNQSENIERYFLLGFHLVSEVHIGAVIKSGWYTARVHSECSQQNFLHIPLSRPMLRVKQNFERMKQGYFGYCSVVVEMRMKIKLFLQKRSLKKHIGIS